MDCEIVVDAVFEGASEVVFICSLPLISNGIIGWGAIDNDEVDDNEKVDKGEEKRDIQSWTNAVGNHCRKNKL